MTDLPIVCYNSTLQSQGIINSSTNTNASFPAANLLNVSTAHKWRANTTSAAAISLGNLGTIDYVAIGDHNFNSQQCTVGINNNSPAGSIIAPVIPATDGPIILAFPAPVTSGSITINIGAAIDEPAYIGVVFTGRQTVLPRGLSPGHAPLPYARATEVYTNMSESGNFLGRVIVRETRRTTWNFSHVTPDDYRNVFDDWLADLQRNPCFFQWAPARYPDEVGFCWLVEDPDITIQHASGTFSINLSVAGIA